jgi:hypothetical protein
METGVWTDGGTAARRIEMKAIGRLARTMIAVALLFVLAPAASALAESPTVTLTSPVVGSYVATHSPAFSGATNDLIDEVTLRVYAGTSVEPAALVETVTTLFPPTGGTWSLEPTTPLPDGTYTAQASQTNLAAETGSSEAVTFNVDTTPPAVSLSPVSSPTNDPTPTFGGGAGTSAGDDESLTLQIYAGEAASGSPVRTLSVTSHGGAWSATPTPAEHLGDGTYTAQAEQSDQAGNTGKSAASTFVVDTTPPAVSLTPVSSPTNDPTPSFEGNAGVASGDIGEVRLKIYAGGTATGSPINTVAVTPLGASWSTTLSEGLADGTYTAQAEQSDEAGNVGKSAPSTFTIDTTPPSVQITSPAKGSFINNVKPVISGTAGDASGDEPTVTVKVYEGSAVSGSPTQTLGVTRSGSSWSTGSSGPQLAEGTYTLQAEQSDEAGNTGTSAPTTFTIKTKGPAVSLTPVPSPTNNATPGFTGGAGVALGDIASVTLKIYSGTEASGAALRTASVAPSGATWATTLTSSEALPDGTYTAQAEQSDEAGDTSTSATSTFKIDTTPPTVQITSPPNGSFINSLKPVISGTAGNASGTAGNSSRDEPTVTVNVYAGSAVSGTPTQTLALARSGSSWSTGGSGPQLAEGTYTLQAEQSDEAGNTGTSAPTTFTIKTKGPAVSLTPLKTPTNNPTPSFSGGAGTAPGDIASVTLKVYAGTKAAGPVLRTVSAPASGGAWSSAAVKKLEDGTYTAQAEQSDAAANVGKSVASTFTVDTVKPVVKLTATPSVRHTSTPIFTGNAEEAGDDVPLVTLKIYKGATVGGAPVRVVERIEVSGGKWSGAPSAGLENGTYTAQAEQADEAGNVGQSQPATVTVASSGPVVTLTPIAAETNDTKPTFGGSAGDAAGDTPVRLKVYAGASASASEPLRKLAVTPTSGTWSTALTPGEALPDGTYTAVAEQSDSLGNTGVSAESTFTLDTVSPAVTLTSPATGSSTSSSSEPVAGAAGTALGDSSSVLVKLVAGSSTQGAPLQTRVVTAAGGSWQMVFEGLAPDTYTAWAEQSDAAGNTGQTEPATFTVTPPAASTPASPQQPSTSFSWLPSTPRTGETVSLLSSSTDPSSPIAGYAWDLLGTGSFVAGQPALSTSFATPGSHVVRLRVTALDGLSSIAAETIPVSGPASPLMQPFPVVKILSTDTPSGIKLRLLRVQAPAGAQIAVTCRNRGCPVKSLKRLAKPARASVPAYVFSRFERSLRAGVVLEIRVSKAGEIGKYTKLVVRRGNLPQRVDLCLDPAAVKPIACPSS